MSFGTLKPQQALSQSVDYCLFGTAQSIIFIDRTTQYDEIDENILVDALEQIVQSLALGERVRIVTINDAAVNSETVFDSCKPGCPDGGFMDALLSTCSQMAARQRALLFRGELVAQLKDIVTNPREYNYSAIVDTLATKMHEMSLESSDNVIIFSDLLENSSQYPWPAIVQGDPGTVLDRLSRTVVVPDIHGANVIAFGIGRNHTAGRPPLSVDTRSKLILFWEAYFRLSNAGLIQISIEYPN